MLIRMLSGKKTVTDTLKDTSGAGKLIKNKFKVRKMTSDLSRCRLRI